MTQRLSILLVEDSEDDAVLIAHELRRGGVVVDLERVETADDMRSMLRRRRFDIIITDYRLPRFSGLGALAVRNEQAPDVPLLVVSGTIGEEVAVGAMKAGAQDYIMKESMVRLVPAVRREVQEAASRRARREAESELRRTQQRLQLVLAATRDAVYEQEVGPDSITFSEGMQAQWGYTLRRVDRASDWLRERTHPDDRDAVADAISAAVAERRDTASVEYRFRRANGEWSHVLDRCTIIYAADGTVQRQVGCLSDLTNLRELEQQLFQIQKMDSIGHLAGGIAHDFNNVLTVIVGYCALMLDRPTVTDAVRRDVEEIRRAGLRATALTRQLLAFSRRQVVQPQLLDLNEVVRNVSGMLRHLIGADIELLLELDPACGLVRADRNQIEQVLINLVANARDAMEGGTIRIQTAPDELPGGTHPAALRGPSVMLAVHDTGSGMDEATRRRVFEPFFTTKPPGKGTGIGLATVYGICRQAGGQIGVQSSPGDGTTFRIDLPRVAGAVPSEADVVARSPRGGSETILLADDESGVRNLFRDVLEAHGYHVLLARNGHEALEIAERQNGTPVQLLVADLVMPGMGGADLATRLRHRMPDLRVMYISGFSGDTLPDAPMLHKPFSPRDLLARIRDVLDDPESG